MGFPDLQDGRPPRHSAGAGRPADPVPAEMPDEDPAAYRLGPIPGADMAPRRRGGGPGQDGGSGGPRPARRTGAHRATPGSGTSPGRPAGDGRALPPGPAPAAPQPREPRPAPGASGFDDGGLAITREAPGARRGAAPQPGAHRFTGRRGPIRGFPPVPGQPDPVYPPGQFSPWNRASTRAAWLGSARGSGEPEAEPGYSALALSDAAADLTSTQTWAVIDDEPPPSPSPPARTDRDWGSHTGEPPGRRAAGARAADSWAAGSRADVAARRAPGTGRLAAGAEERTAGAGALTGPATGPHGLGGLAVPGGPGGPGTGERLAPGGRMAAREAAARAPGDAPAARAPSVFDEARRRQRVRDATAARPVADGRGASEGRRAGTRGRRPTATMAALLLAPVLVVFVVVAGYVYFSGKGAPAAPRAPAPSHPAAPNSPVPTLGPWKHIESRSQDPVPLTVSQLFPAKFTASGQSGTVTITKAGTNCPRAVIGAKLAAAIRKADCTQVLRASYLSTDRKIMATEGVLNLENVTAAEKVGRATGSSEFIKQLPAAHGPTRNLAKGTGIEVAEIKGHYLILIWTEFANLRAPSGKSQRGKLVSFSAGLVTGTANVSLSNRMVTGHP